MNISVRQIEFKSTNGVNTVFGWIYIPAGDVHGIVQICHGMAEHMARYHETMRYFAQNGYIACGIDQIGHGRSAAEGQHGFFGETDGWRTLIDDQYKFHKIVRTEVAEQKNEILLGHSMGSFIARLYAAKYPHAVGGLVLSGTARGGLRVEMAIQAANYSAKRNGALYVDHELDRIAFGGFNERFEPSESKFDWLSRDAGVVRQYVEDSKCGFVLTASGFRDLFILIKKANDRKCFESCPKNIPVFLISGSMDPVGGYGKGPSEIYRRYLKAGVSDVELVLYEGCRHELFHELNRRQIAEELLGWLNDHFAGGEEADFA